MTELALSGVVHHIGRKFDLIPNHWNHRMLELVRELPRN